MTDQPAIVPVRTLTINSRKLPLIATSWVAPIVLLDGNRFPLGWGVRTFTVPADRPVHIQCEMPYIFSYGRAAAILEQQHVAELEYSAPALAWFGGEIGAPGTTKTRGTWAVWLMMGVLGLVLVGGVAAFAVALSL